MSVGCKSLVGPLDDALCYLPVTQSQGMPPRVSLNTSSRASRKVISKVKQTDGGEPAAPPAADNTFTSALDIPPRRRPALRRRGSDGDSPRYRDSSSSSHHHQDKYPSTMDSSSPTEPHPLRRARTTRSNNNINDNTGNTRPRLSRVLSPSTPALVAKSPSSPSAPADFPASPEPDKVESHRAVLAHEVSQVLPTRADPPHPSHPIHYVFTLPSFFLRSRRTIRSQAWP